MRAITEQYRAEFTERGPGGVRQQIKHGLYNREKQSAAYEWLDEVEHGADRNIAREAKDAAWAAVRAARKANTRATIAVIIATVSAAAAIAAIIVPHFWGVNVDVNSQARKQEPHRQYRLGPQ
jgi:hypothetical protein